ncbi:FadR/GntR family transcriptional regulator [Pelagibacterium luteolum]|uniref:DNA-binding transcriptional regulator, FadR family n=1 Tax=Pelagibacterium luteolum TaxID=440168 RepID=A0A1G7YZE0_9HYPH|nr:FadR/GntR family transcriptional regulator [Pelagibacterium luteolum]SDH01851.1 DNA-binding transcriptional regulator, FadR family [Pelagibacterium luteolum]
MLGRTRRPANLNAQVIRELGMDIVSGRFAEHQILPGDTELTDRFQVSRTVIRDAIKALAAKGIVQSRARVGTRVLARRGWNMFDSDVLSWHLQSGHDAALVDQLAEIRMGFEPEAAALAALRRTADDCDAIMHALENMSLSGIDAKHFALHDLEFHKAIAHASANPFMASITSVVEAALSVSFTISSPVLLGEPALAQTLALHASVANAIVERRPEDAAAAMREVIQVGIDRARVNHRESPGVPG